MQARWMDPEVGRFLSVDPLYRNPRASQHSDPQQLGRYTYARNNPIRMIDESGEFAIVVGAVAVFWFAVPIGLAAATGGKETAVETTKAVGLGAAIPFGMVIGAGSTSVTAGSQVAAKVIEGGVSGGILGSGVANLPNIGLAAASARGPSIIKEGGRLLNSLLESVSDAIMGDRSRGKSDDSSGQDVSESPDSVESPSEGPLSGNEASLSARVVKDGGTQDRPRTPVTRGPIVMPPYGGPSCLSVFCGPSPGGGRSPGNNGGDTILTAVRSQ